MQKRPSLRLVGVMMVGTVRDPVLFERSPERYRRACPAYPPDLWLLLENLGVSLRAEAPFVPFWYVFFDAGSEPTPFRAVVEELFGGPPTIAGTPLDQHPGVSRFVEHGFVVEPVHSWPLRTPDRPADCR